MNKKLKRYPNNSKLDLQAYDAADELIISYLEDIDLDKKKILIINDSFGALCVNLSDFDISLYSDSFISHSAVKDNLKKEIPLYFDLSILDGEYDLILIKIPKNLSYFEDILIKVSSLLTKEGLLISSCMIKHMASGAFDLINKYIGETTTSLAQKKARLIFANNNYNNEKFKAVYPKLIDIKEHNYKMINHSNVFSRQKLDIGTRFFLENIPTGNFHKILDIGCGNGIVGIHSKSLNPKAFIVFSDESFMAIKSTKENYQSIIQDSDVEYRWTNCLEKESRGEFDLVLCNPPFHQNNTIGDFIALQMFDDAFNNLVKGGVLRVIGNRHLGYHVKLKSLFGNSKIVNQNKKFVIIDSEKK